MDQIPRRTEMAQVARIAACTVMAAHRRDHDHALSTQRCQPHAVQVVYLGRRALAVCHDCRADSGFLPLKEAERLADGHRHETAEESVSVTLRKAS
jgi:hypothetical protein